MKFSKILVVVASAALVIVPQIALARTLAESKYLANVEHIAKTSRDARLARVHASKSTSYRLQYGYGVCLALDRGKTLNDLNSNITFNGKTSVSECDRDAIICYPRPLPRIQAAAQQVIRLIIEKYNKENSHGWAAMRVSSQ